MIHLYYDSKTKNVERFINKIIQITGWEATRIQNDTIALERGHLVTFTTNIGEVPDKTQAFVKKNSPMLYSVSSSGNRNWGLNFAKAANRISEEFTIPIALKFELSGTIIDVYEFIDIINNITYDSERACKELDIAQ